MISIKTHYNTVLYSRLSSLGNWANFVGFMNKLDLQMYSQNGTCLYVGDLLFHIILLICGI